VSERDAGVLEQEAQRALAPLVGLPLTGSAREDNALFLDFGSHALQVLCAWRLTSGDEIVAGSGDLYTPADPDAELDEFDWQEAGSTWWDLRMRTFHNERDSAPPVVRAVRVDPWLGLRLDLGADIILDVFPHSAAAAHVETEFWRLEPMDASGFPVVASTSGLQTGAPNG
jgi:hypothetical protein